MPRLPYFSEVHDPTAPLERLRELAHMHLEYARALAQNPHTPPSLLEELAHRPEKGVRRALTGNPSTPEVLLFKLACAFPAEFLKNPLLTLLALENPDFTLGLARTHPPDTGQVLGHPARAARESGTTFRCRRAAGAVCQPQRAAAAAQTL